ncbi:MAG: nucleotidyltransferase domain-containing protein [Candidatus Bathyarchaeia archaeon]
MYRSQRSILGLRASYDRLKEAVRGSLGASPLGIILFGSTVYMGRGRDLDLLVIVERVEGPLVKRFEAERLISREIFKGLGVWADVHILDLEELKENLAPGTFLSGLALGYELINGGADVEEPILTFLEKLSNGRYILHNRYGTWDLAMHAKLTIRRSRTSKSHEKSTEAS